jgi:hypothetical protein
VARGKAIVSADLEDLQWFVGPILPVTHRKRPRAVECGVGPRERDWENGPTSNVSAHAPFFLFIFLSFFLFIFSLFI